MHDRYSRDAELLSRYGIPAHAPGESVMIFSASLF
jgi:hypothetical protein